MRKQLIVLSLIIVASALFVMAGTVIRGPIVQSPSGTFINLSKGILLNATFDTDGGFNQNITNVTFMWQDNSTGQYILNTTIRNTSAGQKQFVNTSFNTTILPDGRYNLTVVAYNVSGDGNLTVAYDASGIGYTLNTSVINVIVDNTPPTVTVTIPVVNANVSDEANFNTSINDINLTLKTVIFQFSNGSDPFNVTASNVSGSWNVTLATSRMADGIHNFTVFANDTVDNINATQISNFTVDNTVPTVTFVTGDARNFTTTSGNLTFNVTINDVTLFVNSSIFSFNNATGLEFNVTPTNASGEWRVINFSTDRFEEGNHTLVIYANDSLQNQNATQSITFIIDSTVPNVTSAEISGISSSGGTLTIEANDKFSGISSCTYTGAGTGNLSTGSGTYTATLSGLSASTQYTAVVNCTDFSGNFNQTTLGTFTTSATASTSSSGGGSGTGSSGGVASNVAGQIAKKIWTSVNEGETASVKVANGEIGVTEVEFTAPETVWGLWVKVEKKDELPTTVKSFGKKAYKNLEITKNPALASNALGEVDVKFKVEKSWLAENGLAPRDVALFRYNNNEWVELATTQGEDDGTYVHYSAKTPGFSFFVIGEKAEKTPSASQPPAETLPEEEADGDAPSDEPVAQPEEPTPVEESKNGGMAWLWIVLAVVVIGAAGFWFLNQRR